MKIDKLELERLISNCFDRLKIVADETRIDRITRRNLIATIEREEATARAIVKSLGCGCG
jgi:hypothetical protein